jgi:hypothetical protein
MSSSRRNVPPISKEELKITSKTIYICPQCGKQKMRRVVGPCEFDDGEIIPKLERFHCFSCDSDFFDPPAMDVIEAFWESQRRKSARSRLAKKLSTPIQSTVDIA